MRPPTRSTRSVRPSLNTNNTRRSRGVPGPSSSSSQPVPVASQSSSEAAGSNNLNPPKPNPQLQSIIPTSAGDAKVDPSISSLGSDPAPVVGCFPVLSSPSSMFVYENQNHNQSPSESLPLVAGSIILGKSPRPRHRMSSDKVETLDAFFRRNTHPSRKEKESICKALDM